MVKQVASDKEWSGLTSYELDFLPEHVLIVTFKSEKFEVDRLIFVAMAREKPGGCVFHPLPLPRLKKG